MPTCDAATHTRIPGLPRPLQLACFALCVAHAAYLASAFALGHWFIGPSGDGTHADFVSFWAAGRLALAGQPAGAYDWSILKQVENAAFGFDFGVYTWAYPPPALFLVAPLALFSYAPAFAAWVVATFALYAAVIRKLVGHPSGWLIGGACFAAAANLQVGQNGFITTALIAGTVGLMQRRPMLAGCCLGLLTYKPHFGLLFPLVLLAAGRWTVFWSAAVAALLVALASWLAFGTAAWAAFFHWLPLNAHAFTDGLHDFNKLQSVFGLVRLMGGSANAAWAAQIALSAGLLAGCCVVWRRRVAFELQAAALATAAVLATPYVYMYDLAVLAVPLALLVRTGLADGFRPSELLGLGVAAGLLFSSLLVKGPGGLGASFLVLLLIVRRMLPDRTALAAGTRQIRLATA